MNLIKRTLADQSGNAAVIVSIAFVVLLGFVALAVDGGLLYVEYTRISRAADAAALAGAQELPDNLKAQARAVEYLQKNDVDTAVPGSLTISFAPDNRDITVEIRKNVQLYFARALGFNESDVSGRAVARISPVSRVSGLLPLGIDESLLPLSAGHQYIIKVGAPNTGWTGIIEYPGQSGKDDYKEAAANGYDGIVAIGETQGKAPGNATGPTIEGILERINGINETWVDYSPDSPRVVLIPVYRNLGDLPTDGLEIVGFVSVFLEKVVGHGLENEVYVRYVNHTVSAETDDTITDSYLNSVMLIE